MSHELRTPLNGIIGFSEMIQNEILREINIPWYREYATDIHEADIHLLKVIRDIIDISKNGAGMMELSEDVVVLGDVVSKCTAMVQEHIDRFGLQPFGQAREGADHTHEGIGLGLSLVKNLLEMHEGTLDIKSKLQEGTQVTVRFPASRVQTS